MKTIPCPLARPAAAAQPLGQAPPQEAPSGLSDTRLFLGVNGLGTLVTSEALMFEVEDPHVFGSPLCPRRRERDREREAGPEAWIRNGATG